MPNHVKNRIRASKEVIDSLRRSWDGEEAEVDFNSVIPTPPSIQDTAGPAPLHIENIVEICAGEFDPLQAVATISAAQNGWTREQIQEKLEKSDFESLISPLKARNLLETMSQGKMVNSLDDREFDLFLKYLRAYRDTGCMNWYQWNIENWGTKWNAYSQRRVSDTEVIFETAWSPPIEVFVELANKFPDEVIDVAWSDEDTGNNCGQMQLYTHAETQDQQVIGGPLENGSEEAYQIAFELWPDKARLFVKDKHGNYVIVGDFREYDEELEAGLQLEGRENVLFRLDRLGLADDEDSTMQEIYEWALYKTGYESIQEIRDEVFDRKDRYEREAWESHPKKHRDTLPRKWQENERIEFTERRALLKFLEELGLKKSIEEHREERERKKLEA